MSKNKKKMHAAKIVKEVESVPENLKKIVGLLGTTPLIR